MQSSYSFSKKKKIDSIENLKELLKNFPSMKNMDLASEISTKFVYQWKNKKKKELINLAKKNLSP